MKGKGPLNLYEVAVIAGLLQTDTAILDIARRMGRSCSSILNVNRKFRIRQYRGKRSTWGIKWQ